jgi:hypothetical protein
MKSNRHLLLAVGCVALIAALGVARRGNAQDTTPFLSLDSSKVAHNPTQVYTCKGPVSLAVDTAYEGVKTTGFNWSSTLGGGESGRFDPTPVLSTSVTLAQGVCLDAHFSAIVGSRQTYGPGVASITMFQVTLTNVLTGVVQHMVGHYDTPYGLYGPAVAIEAERDVDTFGSNFFQRVGTQPGDVPPGNYRVDVWWSGGPVGGGGAIGADFVLKLYLR